jgi:hypothetical protein
MTLPRLAELDLRATQVSDASLASLARLPLRHLDVRNTRIAKSAAARLARKTGCAIQAGGRAQLRAATTRP